MQPLSQEERAMQDFVLKVNGRWSVWSWSNGVTFREEKTLEQEAQRCPEAVVNRLMNERNWDLAERIMDEYL